MAMVTPEPDDDEQSPVRSPWCRMLLRLPPNADKWREISDFPRTTFIVCMSSACTMQLGMVAIAVGGAQRFGWTWVVPELVAHVTGISLTAAVATLGPATRPHMVYDSCMAAFLVAVMLLWTPPCFLGLQHTPFGNRAIYSIAQGCWTWMATLGVMTGFNRSDLQHRRITGPGRLVWLASVRTVRISDAMTDISSARYMWEQVRDVPVRHAHASLWDKDVPNIGDLDAG
jgi:hypothetical protein